MGRLCCAGERSDYGAGLQTLLNAFDQGLAVDGAVGNQTLTAVHNMQAALGREQTDTVDADLFAELLKCQYTLQKEKEEQEAQQSSESASGVDNIVRENMDPEEYSYLAGCAFAMNGEYYDAWKKFSACMKEEASARAQACVQNWPETGIIYQNESWSSQENHFTIKIDSMPEGKAAVFKIYAENGDLAAILFIGAALLYRLYTDLTDRLRYADGKCQCAAVTGGIARLFAERAVENGGTVGGRCREQQDTVTVPELLTVARETVW